ncbi:hypothetical protein BDM02DRAFT_3257923 [Thelephora ganbajun]|uniref:Uncharacterized protein n=1 Tax=Thelephora ganbajun TaxID=370292 RepID=A0ACB6ZUT0_THEGA|nr:hypothetical protein BDM02DRAFT_3257923 [Thelephora ganbajun]
MITQILEMDSTMVKIISRLRFAANTLTPICQLPPEILCEVFFHLRPVIRRGYGRPRAGQPFRNLLAVTHTCQHWRATAIAAAELWSQLIIRGPYEKLDLTRLFISRSRELPLDADFEYQLAVIAPYTNRLRALSCSGYTTGEFLNFSDRPAQLLETLHIRSREYHHSEDPLPTLFDGDFPSLRELVVNGYNPLPNNHFRNLTSFHLHLSSVSAGSSLWIPLLEVLRDSPQLEELFLNFDIYNGFPSVPNIPDPAALHALQRLHLRGVRSTLTRRFLNLVDLVPNGIAMQFTNIIPEFDWMAPPTLPPELSLHSVTSLEIIYPPTHGFIVQGTNPGMQIRVAEASDSNNMHAAILSRLIPRTDLQSPLRELWIHIERRKEQNFVSLPEFPHLEKLVVRVTTEGNSIHCLLLMLDVDGQVPCPLLSTLDLSGPLEMGSLVKVLKVRSKGGCRLEKLRLGRAHVLVEDIERLRVQDYVDELELFGAGADAEPCGMELPAVCTTELGEWWESWTKRRVEYL